MNFFPLTVCYLRELFVVDFDTPEGSIHPDNDHTDATLTILNPELDETSYHEETVITEQAAATSETLPTTETLQSKLKKVYSDVEKVKRELDLSQQQKVISTLDKVMELIPSQCKVCGETVTVQHNMSGAVVIIQWNCSHGHADSWTSSDVLTVKSNQKVYVNNVQLCAAILLSGNNFQKFDLLAKFLGLSSISETLYYRVQKLYCCPSIQNMWSNVKETIHAHFQSTGVTLAGDGRNDSPGHTARYCVYTLMEESTKTIVDLEVVDKRETGGKSAAMEKLALVRLLRRLKDVISIDHLVTDASASIKALVRDMKGTVVYCL